MEDCGIAGCSGEPEWKRSRVVLTLSHEEASYLKDIIDWWLDGFEQATNDVITDPTLESPEQMLELVDGMVETHDLAAIIKARLDRVAKVRNG